MSRTAFLHRDIQRPHSRQQQQQAGSPLSLSSHSAHGGAFADSEEKRQLLPLLGWEASSLAVSHSGGGAAGGGKRCSGASGERLRVGSAFSPSSLTFVQRCWLPHRQHFDYYLQERVDAWEQSGRRQQQAEDRERRSRRGREADTAAAARDSSSASTGSRGSTAQPARGNATHQQLTQTVRAFIS
jgi:hypothetical protein